MAKRIPRNFRLGTRSGLICVDIIQGSEAFCLFLCAEKGPPGIILHINSRILLYYYSHPNIWWIYAHSTPKLRTYRKLISLFSSDLEFEKLILNFTRHLFKELCHVPGILTQICAWAVEIIHLFLAGSWIYRWGYRGWSYSELYFTCSTRSVSFTKWWTKNTNDFNSLRPKFYYSKM